MAGTKSIAKFVMNSTKGEDSRTAKLTKQQALHIRKTAWNGVPDAEQAALYGIAKSTVSNIKHCRTWSDV